MAITYGLVKYGYAFAPGASARGMKSATAYAMAMQVPSDGGETILVVDDDDLVLPAAKSLIEKLGYRVLTACNGPEALEILHQDTPIDLLFTDVFMPGGMHGPQLANAARRLRPELKVVFTSGFFEYAEIRQGLDPRIEQISKPYEPNALAEKLRDVLDGSSQ
jgi:CheY-like chemotaxis protein